MLKNFRKKHYAYTPKEREKVSRLNCKEPVILGKEYAEFETAPTFKIIEMSFSSQTNSFSDVSLGAG